VITGGINPMVYNENVDKRIKRAYYLAYTLIFSLFAFLLLFLFYSQGRSMIDAGGDGFRQHFRALLYYSNYLKTVFNNLIHGTVSVPKWDFVIGEGSDILISLNYYCVGDIFTFFSFLVPENYMYLYYDAITIIRIYCAGLAFSALCLYKQKKNCFVILGSAFIYAFCPFALSNLNAHVFFISAAVYFPMIILGVEKVIDGNKPYSLIIAVFLASVSNIYFFYMNVISTVIYVAIRILLLDSEWKNRFIIVGKIALYSFIGVLMSGVVFMPMLYSMLFNTRFGTKILTDMFYSISKYRGYYTGLAFNGYSFFGGFSVLGLFSIVQLFISKKKYDLKVLMLVCLVFVCIPFFGKLYNAMVYPTTRWVYAVSLLVCYTTVDIFDEIYENDYKFILHLSLVILYFGSCLYLDREQWKIHVMFMIMAITLCVSLKFIKKRNLINLLCLGIALFSIFFNIIYLYSPLFWNKSEGGILISDIQKIENDEYSVFNYLKDDSFFRYSGNDLKTNESIQGNKSSTQYYWSVVNDYVAEFRKDLGIADNSNHHYYDYDERFTLNALAGVKYFIDENNGLIPDGYEYLNNYNGYEVYQNSYNLPLIYEYDSYILKDEWKKLDVASRNELVSQAVVIDKEIEPLKTDNWSLDHKELDYKLECNGDITLSDDQIISRNEGGTIKIYCHNDEEGEYYFVFEGLDSKDSVNIDIKYGDLVKTIKFKGRKNLHYTNRHDYLVNLGYMSGIDGTITVKFPGSSDFSYDNIKVVYQDLKGQKEAVEKRKGLTIKKLNIEQDRVIAEVETADDVMACLSIPYSKGWKVKVDGQKAELLNCNIQYMGVFLEKGNHTIELTYDRPMSTAGMLCSIVGFGSLIYLWLKNRKYNKIS